MSHPTSSQPVYLHDLRLETAIALVEQADGVTAPPPDPAPTVYLQTLIDGLCELSLRDPLTGLANRRHFRSVLEREIDRVTRSGEAALLLMLDIDHFKQVNDTYGHLAGDRVLQAVAQTLNACVRPMDTLARYGGEEFAVVLPDTDAATALKVLDEIRQRFAEISYPAQPMDLSCTFSCGIAEVTEDMDTNTLSKQADEALYVAKRGGRNRVEIYLGEKA